MPPDDGVVTPIAQSDERPDQGTEEALNALQLKLVDWPPAQVADPVKRTLNLLSVAAVTDLAQDPVERYVLLLILDHLIITTAHEQLVQVLAWIALHPNQGETINDLTKLGLGRRTANPGDSRARQPLCDKIHRQIGEQTASQR